MSFSGWENWGPGGGVRSDSESVAQLGQESRPPTSCCSRPSQHCAAGRTGSTSMHLLIYLTPTIIHLPYDITHMVRYGGRSALIKTSITISVFPNLNAILMNFWHHQICLTYMSHFSFFFSFSIYLFGFARSSLCGSVVEAWGLSCLSWHVRPEFPDQGLNLSPLRCKVDSYLQDHQGCSYIFL